MFSFFYQIRTLRNGRKYWLSPLTIVKTLSLIDVQSVRGFLCEHGVVFMLKNADNKLTLPDILSGLLVGYLRYLTSTGSYERHQSL